MTSVVFCVFRFQSTSRFEAALSKFCPVFVLLPNEWNAKACNKIDTCPRTLVCQIQEPAIIFLPSTPATSARSLFRTVRLLFSNNRLRGTSILFQFIKRISLLYHMDNSHRHHYSSWHFYLVPKNITDFSRMGSLW